MFGGKTDPLAAVAMLEALKSSPPERIDRPDGFDPRQLDALLTSGSQRPEPAAERLRATVEHPRLTSCVGCGAALDLPAPRVGRPTETWRCLGCNTVAISGLTDPGFARPGVAQRAHRLERAPIAQLASAQPAQLRRLVERLTAADYLDGERRGRPRYPVSLPAIGIPMGEDRTVAGLPVRVTTRDASLDGLSGYTEAPITTPLLLVDLTPGGLVGWQVALRVVRTRVTGFLNEFGGEFVAE